jgi:hypothetical protein
MTEEELMPDKKVKLLIEDKEIKEDRFCPLGDYDCPQNESCAWWVADSGKEECAIVKMAKGWQL